MTEFRREALIDIQRYVDHLREAVESKRINESSIYRLVEGYLDQPGYYPQERVQLLAELQARGFPHSRDALALWRSAEGPRPMTEAERIKELEAKVMELEQRLSGGAGGTPPSTVSGTVYSIPDGWYFENGKAIYIGRGGGR